MTTAGDKVTAKIRKLLAMAAPKSGCSPAEAQQAMSRAQALMAEHNLTASTLGATPGEFGSAPACDGEPAETPYLTPILMRCFEVHVVVIRHDGRADGVVLFGDEANVAAARSAFGFLRASFAGLFDRALAARKASLADRPAYYDGLLRGFLDRLDFNAKLEKLSKPHVGTALAPLRSRLDEAAAQEFPGMSIVRRAGSAGSAFDAGYAASKDVSVARRVGASRPASLPA